MLNRPLALCGVMSALALAVGACGETTSETAEVVTCKQVAAAALPDSQALTFVDTQVKETSEGDEIYLEIEYTTGETQRHAWDKCWFAGYGDNKNLKSFAVRANQSAAYVDIPAEDLAVIRSRIAQ